MTQAIQKWYKGFGFLFMLNWDAILCFGVTALAMAAGAYIAGL